jgi:hypothetical protein
MFDLMQVWKVQLNPSYVVVIIAVSTREKIVERHADPLIMILRNYDAIRAGWRM